MKKILVAFCMTMFLAACGDSSSSSAENANPSNVPGDTKGNGSEDAGCGFSKADNVWKYSYSSWNYIDVYTWVDETTVEFKEYMGSYHMDDNDTTYTGVNLNEFYEQVLSDCQRFNELAAE